MDTQNTLLEMQGISKRFPAVVALDNVAFSLKPGEIHALLGENGAGKSTLIKVLTGVETLDSGTMKLNGKTIRPKSPLDAQKEGISTVYQEVNLCPNLSVAENIYVGREPMKQGRIDWKKMNRNAKEMLTKLDLDLDVNLPLENYSIAIQQMVSIARAIDISAKVLILDEPTSSLSNVEVEKLFQIMNKLKSQGIGIVFVTHFLDQVYEICDTITVLRNGKYVGTYEAAKLSKIGLVGHMIGKEYQDEYLKVTSSEPNLNKSTPFLFLNQVSSNNGIMDFSFAVNKGEVVGFSGLLASGRSEVARLVFGVDKKSKGAFELNGKKVKISNELSAIRLGFAFCPENRKTEGLVGDLTIKENIILALQSKRGMFRKIPEEYAKRIVDEYIEKLAIKTPSADQLIKNLSGGNQQKVILARWLATNPELLILDEPTRGIDIGAKAEIQKIVIDLAKKGMALIFISSEIDEMLRCSDRMMVIRNKKKVAELTGDEMTESSIMNFIAGSGAKHG